MELNDAVSSYSELRDTLEQVSRVQRGLRREREGRVGGFQGNRGMQRSESVRYRVVDALVCSRTALSAWKPRIDASALLGDRLGDSHAAARAVLCGPTMQGFSIHNSALRSK